MSFRIDIVKETASWAEKLEDYGVKATIRLDDKAQQTAGLAGLFLGGFGFLKAENFNAFGPRMRHLTGGLLLATIAVLVVCLVTCLLVTRLQNTPMPIGLETLQGMNEDILVLCEEEITENTRVNFYYDRITLWKDIIERRRGLNRRKARLVLIAQTFLVIGLLFVAILLSAVLSNILRSPQPAAKTGAPNAGLMQTPGLQQLRGGPQQLLPNPHAGQAAGAATTTAATTATATTAATAATVKTHRPAVYPVKPLSPIPLK